VDMFFTLSGFLITGILLDAPKTTARYFSVFYLRRGVRIFPLYFAVLAIVYLTCAPGEDSPLWYWFFASNIGATIKNRWLYSPVGVQLAHFWSLAVEEQFYLVWPLLVRFVNRQHLKWVCLACLVIAPASNAWLYTHGYETASYMFTSTRLNTLGAGALLAIIFREPERWERWMRLAPRVFLISAAMSVFGWITPQSILHYVWFLPTTLIFYAPFLWGSALMLTMKAGSPFQQVLSGKGWVLFGKYSYALYVLHFLFNPWLSSVVYGKIAAFSGTDTVVSLLLYIVATFAVSIGAALVSWNVLERPMLSLKRYFYY